MKLPRVMVAACSSDSGKTTITCALLQALSERGCNPRAYKCGPDYIDPMFHQKVLGIPSKNLDCYFTGEELTKSLFAEELTGNEIAVIEGVMGLYDGLQVSSDEASSYHLAKVLKTPIILVVNAWGMGRSIIPLIAGFLSYDKEHLIAGVILNRTSGPFYEQLKQQIEAELGIKVFGCYPVQKKGTLESRHLGLKMPGEIAGIQEQIQKSADCLKEHVDLDAICQAAGEACELEVQSLESLCNLNRFDDGESVRIGIAMDEAFCFYYKDNLSLLEKMGAELVPFSPLKDQKLPTGIHGLILGGGYPELHGSELSKNKAMREAIRSAVSEGMPLIAECGGFMYLHDEIVVKQKKADKEACSGENMLNAKGRKVCLDQGNSYESISYPMAGVVKGSCYNAGRLVRFGYAELEEKSDGHFLVGEKIRGHEFHYYDSTDNGTDCIARKPVGDISWECVHRGENHWYGFGHLYYYSNPKFAKHFLEQCREYKKAH